MIAEAERANEESFTRGMSTKRSCFSHALALAAAFECWFAVGSETNAQDKMITTFRRIESKLRSEYVSVIFSCAAPDDLLNIIKKTSV